MTPEGFLAHLTPGNSLGPESIYFLCKNEFFCLRSQVEVRPFYADTSFPPSGKMFPKLTSLSIAYLATFFGVSFQIQDAHGSNKNNLLNCTVTIPLKTTGKFDLLCSLQQQQPQNLFFFFLQSAIQFQIVLFVELSQRRRIGINDIHVLGDVFHRSPLETADSP